MRRLNGRALLGSTVAVRLTEDTTALHEAFARAHMPSGADLKSRAKGKFGAAFARVCVCVL